MPFTNILNDDLNEDQAIIALDPEHRDGARCVIAGPGSGKTTTMVKFCKALRAAGVPPSQIVGVTFSKEMAATLAKRAGEVGTFSTFHSLGYKICRELNAQPVEPELRYRLMIRLCKKYHLEYKDLDNFIASMRRQRISPAEAEENIDLSYMAIRAYAEYEAVRETEGWIDFECQPPETKVLMASRTQKRICDVNVGDVVVAWERKNQTLRVQGRAVNGVSQQLYEGHLIELSANSKTTRMTPNHWVWARFDDRAADVYAVYLMWKEGFGFRVGQCKFMSGGYSNWPQRLHHQDADKMWILSVTSDYYESLTREAEISVKYGIPQTVFKNIRAYPSVAAIRRVFDAADEHSGFRCLRDHDLLFGSPLLERRNKMQQWARKRNTKKQECVGGFIKIAACNLIPSIMSLPREGRIEKLRQVPFNGFVYGLSVERDHTYVADGLVVGNSMICDAVDALESNDSVRARWQPQYLIVDEAQDTDDLQWRMMQLMSQKYGNITIVGDPNQAIYSFRGAKPQNLIEFTRWFPGGRYYYLGRNYRSTHEIVQFVRENLPEKTELAEKMVAARTDRGIKTELKMYWRDADEIESALTLANVDPLNSIILARTNRTIGLLEATCAKNNIRYHLLGETSFWKQNEIRKAVELLKAYPGLLTATAMTIALPPLERKYAVNDRTDQDNDALENIKVLKTIGEKFRMTGDFVVYANKMIHRRNDPHGVTLSTIHQAKGGEWKNVFLVGAKADMIPHKKGDFAEERRLFLVAISRPKDRLRISWCGTPSPLLRKYLPENVMDELRNQAEQVERLQKQHSLFGD